MRIVDAIEASRIYVAGLSAGASMATILAATYPDVFAVLAVVAGVPYGAASDCLGAFDVMRRIAARLYTPNAMAAWANYRKAYGTCILSGYFIRSWHPSHRPVHWARWPL